MKKKETGLKENKTTLPCTPEKEKERPNSEVKNRKKEGEGEGKGGAGARRDREEEFYLSSSAPDKSIPVYRFQKDKADHIGLLLDEWTSVEGLRSLVGSVAERSAVVYENVRAKGETGKTPTVTKPSLGVPACILIHPYSCAASRHVYTDTPVCPQLRVQRYTTDMHRELDMQESREGR